MTRRGLWIDRDRPDLPDVQATVDGLLGLPAPSAIGEPVVVLPFFHTLRDLSNNRSYPPDVVPTPRATCALANFTILVSREDEPNNGEFFGKIKSATSMIEVKRLIDPDMLVEVEADAIMG